MGARGACRALKPNHGPNMRDKSTLFGGQNEKAPEGALDVTRHEHGESKEEGCSDHATTTKPSFTPSRLALTPLGERPTM